jgi:hypothetical protein
MRFRYRAYPVQGAGSRHVELIWRPVISLRAFGGGGGENLFGLIDTGADDTLLPEFLIDRIGVVLPPDEVAEIEGIDGTPIVIRYASVELQLEDPAPPHRVHRWKARVGFHRRYNAILGHSGFLEYFIAMFNGRTREVILKAHDLEVTP